MQDLIRAINAIDRTQKQSRPTGIEIGDYIVSKVEGSTLTDADLLSRAKLTQERLRDATLLRINAVLESGYLGQSTSDDEFESHLLLHYLSQDGVISVQVPLDREHSENNYDEVYYRCNDGEVTVFDAKTASFLIEKDDAIVDIGAGIDFFSQYFYDAEDGEYGYEENFETSPLPTLESALLKLTQDKNVMYEVSLFNGDYQNAERYLRLGADYNADILSKKLVKEFVKISPAGFILNSPLKFFTEIIPELTGISLKEMLPVEVLDKSSGMMNANSEIFSKEFLNHYLNELDLDELNTFKSVVRRFSFDANVEAFVQSSILEKEAQAPSARKRKLGI